MAINKVILLGNVGKEPEIRAMSSGNEMAIFSVATTDFYKDKNTHEKKEKTEWHNIVVYSIGLVNIVKNYIHKGTKIYLEGSLHTRKWTDDSGVDKYITEILLQGFDSKIEILSSNMLNSNDINEDDNVKKEEINDDIPF